MISTAGIMSTTTHEVESADVIKLILQFCKENHLLHTMRTLQDESKVVIIIDRSPPPFPAAAAAPTFRHDVCHYTYKTFALCCFLHFYLLLLLLLLLLLNIVRWP